MWRIEFGVFETGRTGFRRQCRDRRRHRTGQAALNELKEAFA